MCRNRKQGALLERVNEAEEGDRSSVESPLGSYSVHLDFIPDKDGVEAGRPLGRLYSDVLGWSSDQGGRGAKELDYDSVLTVGLLQLWVLLLSRSASFLLAVSPLAIPGG